MIVFKKILKIFATAVIISIAVNILYQKRYMQLYKHELISKSVANQKMGDISIQENARDKTIQSELVVRYNSIRRKEEEEEFGKTSHKTTTTKEVVPMEGQRFTRYNGLYDDSKEDQPKDYLDEIESVGSKFRVIATDTEDTIVNITNFRIPLNRPDICNSEKVDVVTTVHSAPNNFQRRSIIRTTWGNSSTENLTFRVIFLLGETGSSDVQAKLTEEATMFGDLIQGGFVDAYKNLSYKSIFGLYWVTQYCKQAPFIIKIDDDFHLDLYYFHEEYSKLLKRRYFARKSFIAGTIIKGHRIPTFKASKWYTRPDEIDTSFITDNWLPYYASGGMYVTTPETALRLVEAARTYPFFWLEDAWINGLLARELNIERKSDPRTMRRIREAVLIEKVLESRGIITRTSFAVMVRSDKRSAWFQETLTKYSRMNYLKKMTSSEKIQLGNKTEAEVQDIRERLKNMDL